MIKKTKVDNFVVVEQQGGAMLGYSPESGVKLIEKDGFLFKDLARTGELLPYEDWRLPAEERAHDLASRMTIRQIAGLMLYSNHQAIPATTYDVSPYDGKPYQEGVTPLWAVTDNQKKFLRDDNLRHVLVTTIRNPETAARWNNRVQAFVEGLGLGIPANNSSDPRHTARADAEFNAGGGGAISMWPSPMGLAATFDPEEVRVHGEVASKEYRALGFATALSPQVDLGTEPRWYRFYSTFGSEPNLCTAMAKAYCEGFQTTNNKGWGNESVNCMVKHWPGGAPCESGRDAHYGNGKYAVYPGGNYELHKRPFVEGAFKLDGGTHYASAVMPYYTIATASGGERVGNGFSEEVIANQLRGKVGYEGVVCTDWLITHDEVHPGVHSGKPWGVEHLTPAQRHYKALKAGVDQFGGNNDIEPVLEAYQMGVAEFGKEATDQRMRRSAYRLLLNMFRTCLFENPYLDVEQSKAIVGCPEFMERGYIAQQKSVVLLKNKANLLPIAQRKKVYIPSRHRDAYRNFWGATVAAHNIVPVAKEVGEKYYDMVEKPEEADFAIVFIDSPMGGWGYNLEEVREQQGNGYHPISLQYADYLATVSRGKSLAGGDPYEDSDNRSYLGKSTKTVNYSDLVLVQETRRQLGDRPMIVVVNITNAPVVSEIEPLADALLFTFDIQNQAVLDIVKGLFRPVGRLPFQVPANMETVELHCEDTPLDMRCHVDTEGNIYDFGFSVHCD